MMTLAAVVWQFIHFLSIFGVGIYFVSKKFQNGDFLGKLNLKPAIYLFSGLIISSFVYGSLTLIDQLNKFTLIAFQIFGISLFFCTL